MPQVVKHAIWKRANAHDERFMLVKIERGVFRWIVVLTGQPWDGVDYLCEGDAIKSMRVTVESSPLYVGVDMTLEDVTPTPEERTAEKIWSRYDRQQYDSVYFPSPRVAEVEALADIIRQETNLPALTTAVSEMLAWLWTRRRAIARALCPPTPNGEPRDITMDGLLLNCIEAMQTTTGQDFSGMIKSLKEPVGQIAIARNMPMPKGPVQ
jgi:hypothetical protein